MNGKHIQVHMYFCLGNSVQEKGSKSVKARASFWKPTLVKKPALHGLKEFGTA